MNKKLLFASIILIVLSIILWHSSYDLFILGKIAETRNTALNLFFEYFTHLGSWRILFPFALIIVLFFRNKNYAIPLSLGILTASIFNTAIKYVVGRPRPALSPLVAYTSYSFPSGHTMVNAVFVYFLYKYMFSEKKNTIIPLLGYSLLMAYSRLHLGVHYPSDILAGYGVAFAFISIFNYLFTKYILLENNKLSANSEIKK